VTTLTTEERDLLSGSSGPATQMAMRILLGAAQMLGASSLISIKSAHIDSCLYHGDSGTAFVERLASEGGSVKVPSTLNVGSLDLVHHNRVNLPEREQAMALRLMDAYVKLGCLATWTCAPYQAGHRPAFGDDVAWGESNAVVFCNSILGARTNRYGDFLDICAALTGRVPRFGLHLDTNRKATILVDAGGLSNRLLHSDSLYPVLGRWLGKTVGDSIAAIDGLPRDIKEDSLKALGASAAAVGAVGLFHVVGVTPEAPNLKAVFAGENPKESIRITAAMLDDVRCEMFSQRTDIGDAIDAVAVGSPHASAQECRDLAALLGSRKCRVPFYCCTGRHVLAALEGTGVIQELENCGVAVIVDTCVVVTPILPKTGGLLVTNSGKFAHYATSNIGYDVAYASIDECVESAITGRFIRWPDLWR
jgi:predicted aconitase